MNALLYRHGARSAGGKMGRRALTALTVRSQRSARAGALKGSARARTYSRCQETRRRAFAPSFVRWAMRDSNPHGLRHQILSLACLPISAIAPDAHFMRL